MLPSGESYIINCKLCLGFDPKNIPFLGSQRPHLTQCVAEPTQAYLLSGIWICGII